MAGKKTPKKEYALYKGDEFISIGTIRELAELLGRPEDTVRFYHTPAYQKRNFKNGYILINIEDDEEE